MNAQDETLTTVLAQASARGRAAQLPYAGEVTPQEANAIMQTPGVKLIDVRSRAEWSFVGRIPGSHLVPWAHYDGAALRPNPRFLEELAEVADRDEVILLLCRSAKRSKSAAAAAAQAGWSRAFDILEGFEGDPDGDGHRNSHNGWRWHGLPWRQE